MKINYPVKSTALSAILIMAFIASASYADDRKSSIQQNTQSAVLYHAKQGKLLAESLEQIAQITGITFKIDTDLGRDVVNQTIDADSWYLAIKALLVNYNFATIQESNTIKTVIVSGRIRDNTDEFTSLPMASIEDYSYIEHPLSFMQFQRESTE